MIIDTDALRAAIVNSYADKAKRTDENVRSDAQAMRALTRLEDLELSELDPIDKAESLAKEYELEPTITRAKGGTAERTENARFIAVPDLWHLALELPGDQFDANTARGAVLETWHLCHDLLKHIKGE